MGRGDSIVNQYLVRKVSSGSHYVWCKSIPTSKIKCFTINKCESLNRNDYKLIWPVGLTVRSLPFQGGNTSSTLVRATICHTCCDLKQLQAGVGSPVKHRDIKLLRIAVVGNPKKPSLSRVPRSTMCSLARYRTPCRGRLWRAMILEVKTTPSAEYQS